MPKFAPKNNSKGRRRKSNPAPIFFVILGSFILLIALLFSLRKPATSFKPQVVGAPSIKADQEKIDLGDVKLGKVVSPSFKIMNVGDQPLQITKDPYVEVVEGC
jgi:hypothetical protein